MTTADTLPPINQIKDFIKHVRSYPVSVKQLLELAADTKASKEIKDFYGSFPDDQTFDDQEDLLARSEQVEILRSMDMPQEVERSTEEY